ncbi:MAG: DEAD/DEAH box helicase [Thermoanaerobaculales bacterium]|jgi:superfamily II DNA or RNA helicase|nr:DEAD/DEAH box helicase [Thermoanaerobaculales bacterium]
MTSDSSPGRTSDSRSGLFEIHTGEVLGKLPRSIAERGYHLYQDRRVIKITWTGQDLDAELVAPVCTVRISDVGSEEFLASACSSCGEQDNLCFHAAATMLQWLDIRATMQRLGPGAMWRANSRHPFISPGKSAAERVDLSHLGGTDLRSALELQLSLQRTGSAIAVLEGNEVEVRIALPSGDTRLVFFTASNLPGALPMLRTLPAIRLEGELAELELSEARLRPVLKATWDDQGIILEPGYRLGTGQTFTAEGLNGRIHGRWARIGNHLCRLLDPATPLVPYFRQGRRVLKGKDALRFLNLDHPQLRQHPWYLPQGQLAGFRQPAAPVPLHLEAERVPNGKIRIRPRFTVGDHELPWGDALTLVDAGFTRIGSTIVRAPELEAFEGLGFKLPLRRRNLGLLGSRTAFIRLLAETGLPVVGPDPELVELAAVLNGRVSEEVVRPPGLRSRLRPYQAAGVAWLWSRYLVRVGALLADDMGLGKTHQVMGLLCLLAEREPEASTIVVCPRGVLEHWHTLLATFAPELRVHLFHGPTRSLRGFRGGIVLTTYDILFRSTAELMQHRWAVVVFDEAQRIKNPRTKAARAARKIPADFRLALTGTPLENRLLELWSVVDLIVPGYLGSEREFRTTHRDPSHHQLHVLRQRLGVLTLRRVKEQVLADLPEKFEDLRFCHLLPAQAALYRSLHARHTAEIVELLRAEDAEIPTMHIFALLTRLKQVCDHPALVDDQDAASAESAKIEVFDEILDEALDGGLQVVVFSQYVKMIAILSEHLERRRVPHLVLTGETRDRGRIIRRFNSEQHERVLLASLLAGGVGIDLTGASVVLHYDRWWNPAKENQATDRVHRIGQRRFVQVFKLITRDTIEERIDELIRAKVELMERVVAPTEDLVAGLDRSDLIKLLDLDLRAHAPGGTGDEGAAAAGGGP